MSDANVVTSEEVWMEVPQSNGRYFVSNLGLVKSMAFPRVMTRNTKHTKRTMYHLDRTLKPSLSKSGYNAVGLSYGGKINMWRVHRLVAFLFIPNPLNKPHIDHINGIKTDNRAENLRWVTPFENMQNPLTSIAISKGLVGKKLTWDQPGNAVNKIDLLTGEILETFTTVSHAAKSINKGRSNIVSCCKGRLKHIYGYNWQYVNPESVIPWPPARQ